ncbi:hypothetical protein CLOSTHATH_03680 [Hungatella hathewayi DSM 13479]|uniref:Uncharacterized protein n=1 Tax=Hungatella hathewayi DSM 13479 TaxID=566550 RepID=D3AJ90_9FIRM|nr:hypothetical protein CLOSTHATH_03680 [Hungatella hathewayi DSM 13479]
MKNRFIFRPSGNTPNRTIRTTGCQMPEPYVTIIDIDVLTGGDHNESFIR